MSLHQTGAEIWSLSALLIAAPAVLGLVPDAVLWLAHQSGHRG